MIKLRKSKNLARIDVINVWANNARKFANADASAIQDTIQWAINAQTPITLLTLQAHYNDLVFNSSVSWR